MTSPLASTHLNLEFKSPFLMASGNAGFGFEYNAIKGFDYSDVGGVFLKGTTLKPRSGNPDPRVIESSNGIINAVGLENPGVDIVITKLLDKINWEQTNYFANVSGSSIDEYVVVAAAFAKTNLAGIELNISCPNIKNGGAVFGNDPKISYDLIKEVRLAVPNKPLIVKLSPNQADIAASAEAAILAGADAISAINTVSALSIDYKTGKPHLYANYGGLSGAAIKPIALAMISKIYPRTKDAGIPLIGMGGICCSEDAIEFFLAGADLLAVGSILAKNPLMIQKLNKELERFLNKNNTSNFKDLVGSLNYN